MTAAIPLLTVTAFLVASVALVLALGVAVRVRELEARIVPVSDGLPIGAEAPRQPLTELLGGRSTWLDRSLLIFGSGTCQPCRDLLAALSERVTRADWPIVVIESEPASDGSLAEFVPFPIATWVTDNDGAIREAFGAQATPHTFLVRNGRIADRQLGADVPRVLSMLVTSATNLAT